MYNRKHEKQQLRQIQDARQQARQQSGDPGQPKTPSTRPPQCQVARIGFGQRAGRAGRQGPGRCLRLYTRHDHDARPEFETPEIEREVGGRIKLARNWKVDLSNPALTITVEEDLGNATYANDDANQGPFNLGFDFRVRLRHAGAP